MNIKTDGTNVMNDQRADYAEDLKSGQYNIFIDHTEAAAIIYDGVKVESEAAEEAARAWWVPD